MTRATDRDLELPRAEDAAHILVLAGGTILDEDVPALEDIGVTRVFGAGTTAVARPATSES